ncbi:MAG: UDP-N-acetylmuramate dehydrogenase [Methylophilaceae bacterium]|jgi:UDP-N-acetylmuramate dehydrogenase
MEKNKIHHNIELKSFNSWKVGGVAENFYICADKQILSNNIKKGLLSFPLYFIGLGSNTLFRDGVIKGTIIMMHKGIGDISQEINLFYADAGVSCSKLAKQIAKAGFARSAFLAGIPGTIGGALAMNAGCYGSETWDYVSKVLVIDAEGNQIIRFKEEFKTGYRKVINKKKQNEYFLGAWFNFPKGQSELAQNEIKDLLLKRKKTQPLDWPTAGSTFRNPHNNYAAKLIEECNLKGYTIGGAQISKKHANFIINLGNASAIDIEKLIEYVRERVFDLKKIMLETEIKFIGDNYAPK